MNKPLHAEGGVVAMDRFHDRDAYFLEEARRREQDCEAQRTPGEITRQIIGDGNVSNWSASKLNTIYALAHIAKNHIPEESSAVYIIGTIDARCVKVGKADSPTKRLSELQTGNPDVLYLHRVFWFDDAATAGMIEKKAHAALEKKWRRLAGEWFECPVVSVHDAIIFEATKALVGYVALTPYSGGDA